MSSKLITVFGSTGAQGGSVVKSILQNKSGAFKVRGITRNPNSDAAKQLASAGVEVVKGNGFNKDEMLAAFKGSYGVFVNTNSDDPAFDDPKNPTELDLGKLLVDTAADAGVKHFIYSSGASPSALTNGELMIPTFENKNQVGTYALTSGKFDYVTIVDAGWYLENFLVPDLAPVLGGFPLNADNEGYMSLVCPKWGGKEDVPFIGMMDDYGDIVHGMFLDPKAWNGKTIQGVSEAASFDKVASDFEKVTGTKSRYVPLPSWKDLPTFGVKSLETIRHMFGYCQISGGLYFGEPTETHTAATLKRIATEAQGKIGSDAELMTVEKFFGTHFAK
ncbi:NAD(P)-binding protein [Eremomyces bilateralis CBS 781.70]|uniref:NAD(P)-binding protein n=1 Tax=Eremomyces bilateralis CBS 781.70 TaxID=1392243 RepID=A0A6G1G3N9_9PEZI|nr:NAD(P)-binding protein [Eremomyces bilateralis CBS 781.70]KAF1812526.1 NAD(P)-binding protein [Eremomyces bilateralis CBS 781.70]